MEKRFIFNFLSNIAKRTLLRAFLSWKLVLPLVLARKKYKKLMQYTSNILKTQHIPNIKIETSEKRNLSSEKFPEQQTDLIKKKPDDISQIILCRSNSNSKSTLSRPPAAPSKKPLVDSEYENFAFQSPHKNPPKPTRPRKIIIKNSEEIAVVSSNALLTEIKLENYYQAFLDES